MSIDDHSTPIDERATLVRSALCDLRFPAARWRILAEAAHRGLSPLQCHHLGTDLPEREFSNLTEVVATILRQSSRPDIREEALAVRRAELNSNRAPGVGRLR
ncbi:hypothetical protein [Pseudonocardia sp. EC080610-09]|uniref:hypothetical protein n=1 Tax=Pseudonocardia sp. EC080610-09 TaxID=1688404 RepID=UPI000B2D0DED|nr:hypothetical protein [Pseudonocardia sp. EC080610-09]